MDKLSVSHLLRLGLSGVVGYMAMFYIDPDAASRFEVATGLIGFPLALLATGSVLYFIYRPLVYHLLISPLITNDEGYRRFLHHRYSIDLASTDRLWRLIQRRLPPGENGEFRVWTSGIHLTYICGILTLVAAAIAFGRSDAHKGFILLALGLVSLTAAVYNNVLSNRAEFDRLRSLSWDQIDPIVAQFQRAVALEAPPTAAKD